MRNGSTKPPGWGLPGGRMEFPNPLPESPEKNLSVTVKLLCFNADGEILLVFEKYLESKIQKTEQTFEQALMDMEALIAHIQSKKSPITYEQVMAVLNETVPKQTGLLRGLKKFFTAEEIGDRKIDPNLTLDWDPNSEPAKIILTAIRESLEETGLLIQPVPIVEIPRGADHKMVICLANIVGGKLKQETKETHGAEWFSLSDLPLSNKEVNDGDLDKPKRGVMYHSHKALYLPGAFRALLKADYPFPETVRQKILQFLAQQPAQNPS